MANSRPSPRLPLAALLLAVLALLAWGALEQRQAFLTRGIPADLPQPITGAGPHPGINVTLEQYTPEELETELEKIKSSGFVAVKQSFYFSSSFDWQSSDRLLEAVRESGLQLVALLDGDPADTFAPPSDPADFAAWAGQFAARYGEEIYAYIIWDEPNLTNHWGGQPVNAAEYAALLSAASATIRQADSSALIVAAPLAPTVETGPKNIADPLYLQQMYEAGAGPAFDVVAAKPYGFAHPPDDRTVDLERLNFSRAILLREVLLRNGEANKAVWAGNWGWNSLPAGWSGRPSIWGQVDEATQTAWTADAWQRAQQEWPWMGYMFLENWQPDAPADDPRWGFSVAGRSAAGLLAANAIGPDLAGPGFHLAQAGEAGQTYQGGWRFSPEYGADISQSGDSAAFRFWGTDVALRVRRADFRARLHITVDGQPANALPRDEDGAALVLTSPDSTEDYLATVWVARDLPAGEHTLSLTASRGWDQWALNGFNVGYRPPDSGFRLARTLLWVLLLGSVVVAVISGRKVDWFHAGGQLRRLLDRLGQRLEIALTLISAVLVGISGWLTWESQLGGIYRRLGDAGQLGLTAAAASIFYLAPWLVVYGLALLALFVLIYWRPVWAPAIIAFSFPLYVQPKAMMAYRFSPVEIYILVGAAAFFSAETAAFLRRFREKPYLPRLRLPRRPADLAVLILVVLATLSLPFTERLNVASNEWRVLIIEPALFYWMLRRLQPRPQQMWLILDAFVLGGAMVAAVGLFQVITGQNLITAEGGLLRLRSFYGSPNNVALYLGRVLPLLGAFVLMGRGRRRVVYGILLLLCGLAVLLTFSKGAFFLGLPAAFAVVFIYWQKLNGRRAWPWLLAMAAAGAAALLLALQVPQLAARLNPQGSTGVFRLNLWQASLEMIRQHPWTGVGLDNFLYAYRGRYILDAAWQEPDLNHPHNLFLDFATRLGLPALAAGLALFAAYLRLVWRLPWRVPAEWRPVAVALPAALAYTVAHGLVDHSFFLVDLALAFYLLLAAAIWLNEQSAST